MKRLITGIPFCNYHYYKCEHRTFDVMLRFYGYATPLILHGTWYFSIERKENGDFEISSASQPLFTSLARCGIRVFMHKEPTVGVVWNQVVSQISGGHPVPILADQRHLEDHYFVRQGSDGGHYVILDGFDEDAETVHVVDPSPGRRFRGDLPFSGFFVDNWSGDDPNRPGPNWYEINCLEPRWDLTVQQALYTIQENVRVMFSEKDSYTGRIVGLKGLQALADDLVTWKDLKADQARAKLKRLSDLLNSVLMEREGHGDYLKLLEVELGLVEAARVAELVRKITQKWYILRNLCMKGQRRALEATLEKLPRRMLEIVSLEEEALLKLKSLLDQWRNQKQIE